MTSHNTHHDHIDFAACISRYTAVDQADYKHEDRSENPINSDTRVPVQNTDKIITALFICNEEYAETASLRIQLPLVHFDHLKRFQGFSSPYHGVRLLKIISS